MEKYDRTPTQSLQEFQTHSIPYDSLGVRTSGSIPNALYSLTNSQAHILKEQPGETENEKVFRNFHIQMATELIAEHFPQIPEELRLPVHKLVRDFVIDQIHNIDTKIYPNFAYKKHDSQASQMRQRIFNILPQIKELVEENEFELQKPENFQEIFRGKILAEVQMPRQTKRIEQPTYMFN
jgi:hypothetical protein